MVGCKGIFMEDIFELLVSIFLEGSIEVVKEKRIPKWIRLIGWILILVFYSALLILFVCIFLQSSRLIVRCLMGVLTILLLAMFAVFLNKLMK